MSAEQWDQSRNDTADVAASETVVTVSKLLTCCYGVAGTEAGQAG